jgi:hypothetical protein
MLNFQTTCVKQAWGGGWGGGALGERILFFPTLLSFNFFHMHIFQLPMFFFYKNLHSILIP